MQSKGNGSFGRTVCVLKVKQKYSNSKSICAKEETPLKDERNDISYAWVINLLTGETVN